MATALKTEFTEVVGKINEQMTTQQSQIRMQQNMATEQMKAMKLLNDQMEQIRNDQSKLTEVISKLAGVEIKASSSVKEE